MKAKSLRYLFDKIISLQHIGNEQRNRIQELKQLNTELQEKLDVYEDKPKIKPNAITQEQLDEERKQKYIDKINNL